VDEAIRNQMKIGVEKLRKTLALWMFICLAMAPVAARAQNVDIDAIKAALLNDPLFLSHLRDRLSVDTLDDSHIRNVVRTYLLDNPDMLVEMQQMLMAKNEQSEEQSREEAARLIAENAAFLFDNEQDLILGNAKGDIKIVEFYDYNCGYCKAAYLETLDLLKKDKNLSLVMKDFPILGEDSARAHLVAQAVKKQAPQHYPSFHHQMMTLPQRANEAIAMDVALSLGIDKSQVQQAMTQEEIQIVLVENAKFAYLLGLNFTPAYIVGSEVVRGAVNNQQMEAVIAGQREAKLAAQ